MAVKIAAMSASLRVVVADDDPDAVLSLRALLEDEGYEVKTVTSGPQALDAVRDFGADVLLLDIGMPLMSGYEVARILRERYASAKPMLIAVTGRQSVQDKSLAHNTGFDHYVAKPYDPNQLLGLLRQVGKIRGGANRDPA
jgi:CheY-like chemotaxis protein